MSGESFSLGSGYFSLYKKFLRIIRIIFCKIGATPVAIERALTAADVWGAAPAGDPSFLSFDARRDRICAQLQRAADRMVAGARGPGGWAPVGASLFESRKTYAASNLDASHPTGGLWLRNMGRSAPQQPRRMHLLDMQPDGRELKLPKSARDALDPAARGKASTWNFVVRPEFPGVICLGLRDRQTRSISPSKDCGHSILATQGCAALPASTHDSVLFAGSIRFAANGSLLAWDNRSGHYAPHPGLARQLDLPQAKFYPRHIQDDLDHRTELLRRMRSRAVARLGLSAQIQVRFLQRWQRAPGRRLQVKKLLMAAVDDFAADRRSMQPQLKQLLTGLTRAGKLLPELSGLSAAAWQKQAKQGLTDALQQCRENLRSQLAQLREGDSDAIARYLKNVEQIDSAHAWLDVPALLRAIQALRS